MRILVAHNRYKFAGGEDTMVNAEAAMLRDRGHEVELIKADNRDIAGFSGKIAAALSTFHSVHSRDRMREAVRRFRPDVLHVHNWFPLLSPSILGAAAEEGVAIVHTLHNFRMVCAGASLYRDGDVCHDCLGRALPFGGVLHGCYSQSRIGTAVVAAAFAYHRAAHTWKDVGTFIALTEFQRDLLAAGGVDRSRLVVKPNFVRDRGGPGEGAGNYAVFVGRLTAEKGILTVLDAWESGRMAIPLRIYGDGPLAAQVRERCERMAKVEYLGYQTGDQIDEAMCGARFLVFGSLVYEPFALTIIEAFSRGTPVLAANRPSIGNLVREGETGICFRPGDVDHLIEQAGLLLSDEGQYRAMRGACRRLYEQSYTEDRNYTLLMAIYERSIRLGPVAAAASDVLAEGGAL